MPAETSSRASPWRRRDESVDRRYRQGQAENENEREPAPGKRIYVGNMPYTAQRQDVERILESEGFEVGNIDISIDPFTFRNPSYCFVDMLTPEDAERAMRVLPGKSLRGRPLKVKPCVQKRSTESRSHSDRLESTRWRSQSREIPVARRDHSSHKNTATDLPIPLQENRRLYVGGLPRPVDNHASDLEIRDIFRGFDVESVSKVQWPRREGTRGNAWYAFVDVSTAEEARRARGVLNGTQLWGGTITVNLARGSPGQVLDIVATEE
ncbi:hypothetical protein BDU57DRAFT_524337 [Ampelomyces quisqualis]|uniref:RRM domain-containing protein n=1 Tax=Ampelomyces quisqualis TaxID=50730 RepID=A0A6A5QAJ4_AMPQU|nr:hypothetical protein BDU57DRAFT_524337 [Ampelomyces quisqualis]